MQRKQKDLPDERRIKHQRVIAYLDAHALEAVLLSRRCSFSWYTCGAHNYVCHAADAGNSWLLVARDGAKVLTTNIEAARLRNEELADSGIEVLEHPYQDEGARNRLFAEATAGLRVAADVNPPWMDLPALGADFDRLRWTLTAGEIERYRALGTDTALAVESAARGVPRGATEHQAAGVLAGELRSRGCVPWVLLVAGDDRVERFRHPLPTGRAIERCFMLVACAERGGLISVCTRLACFGRLAAELARRHQAVVRVDAAMILATRPGATLGAIYDEGRRAYAAVGFADEWRLHHQGGSCGYLPRDVIAGPDTPIEALANQAFAWNPSITGTKSEDTILCAPDGPQLLREPTDWPTISAEWEGASLDRPAILERP